MQKHQKSDENTALGWGRVRQGWGKVGAGLDLGWTMGLTIKVVNSLNVSILSPIGLDYEQKLPQKKILFFVSFNSDEEQKNHKCMIIITFRLIS